MAVMDAWEAAVDSQQPEEKPGWLSRIRGFLGVSDDSNQSDDLNQKSAANMLGGLSTVRGFEPDDINDGARASTQNQRAKNTLDVLTEGGAAARAAKKTGLVEEKVVAAPAQALPRGSVIKDMQIAMEKAHALEPLDGHDLGPFGTDGVKGDFTNGSKAAWMDRMGLAGEMSDQDFTTNLNARIAVLEAENVGMSQEQDGAAAMVAEDGKVGQAALAAQVVAAKIQALHAEQVAAHNKVANPDIHKLNKAEQLVAGITTILEQVDGDDTEPVAETLTNFVDEYKNTASDKLAFAQGMEAGLDELGIIAKQGQDVAQDSQKFDHSGSNYIARNSNNFGDLPAAENPKENIASVRDQLADLSNTVPDKQENPAVARNEELDKPENPSAFMRSIVPNPMG